MVSLIRHLQDWLISTEPRRSNDRAPFPGHGPAAVSDDARSIDPLTDIGASLAEEPEPPTPHTHSAASDASYSSQWHRIDADTYARCVHRFGASFALQPEVVGLFAELHGLSVSYMGCMQDNQLVAALPVANGHIVPTTTALHELGVAHALDIGEGEVLPPIAPWARIDVPYGGDRLSPLRARNISNLRRETRFSLVLAHQYSDAGRDGAPRQLRRTSRKKLHRFDEAGGRHQALRDFPPAELAAIYATLFARRWGCPPPGMARLAEVFGRLHELLAGRVLFIGTRPIAIQINYRVEIPEGILITCVNGGEDPEFSELDPGCVLRYLNAIYFEAHAQSAGKPLRVNLGGTNRTFSNACGVLVPAFYLEGQKPRPTLHWTQQVTDHVRQTGLSWFGRTTAGGSVSAVRPTNAT